MTDRERQRRAAVFSRLLKAKQALEDLDQLLVDAQLQERARQDYAEVNAFLAELRRRVAK